MLEKLDTLQNNSFTDMTTLGILLAKGLLSRNVWGRDKIIWGSCEHKPPLGKP